MVEGDLKEFTKRMKEMLSTVALTERIKVINFLNSSEQSALDSMTGKFEDVAVMFEGGFESAERRRGIIFPSFMMADGIDTRVSIFKIEVIGSGEVTHSQILGALMGLAIDRSVIGDIIVDEKGAFFAACREFDSFLKTHFTKVGRHDIRLEPVTEKLTREQKFEEIDIIVSSMRLDVIVKALMNASRGKAEEYLEAGFVRLNHGVEKKASRVCQMGDILSIRKQGRFKLIENKKTTKRGKFVVVVSKSV